MLGGGKVRIQCQAEKSSRVGDSNGIGSGIAHARVGCIGVGPIRAAYEGVDPEHADQRIEGSWPVRRRVHEDVGIDDPEVTAARSEAFVVQRRQAGAGDEADPHAWREITPRDMEGPPRRTQLVDVADDGRPPAGNVRRACAADQGGPGRAIEFGTHLQGRLDELPRCRSHELAGGELETDEAGLQVMLQFGEVGFDAGDRRPGPKRSGQPHSITVVGREDRFTPRE